MSEEAKRAGSEDIFRGGGEMGALMRSLDWGKTPLGPVETWSLTLRTTLNILLAARHPMLLWWGEELIQFYNDGYLPIIGAKHPQALANGGSESLQEIWHLLLPPINSVMTRGESVWQEDCLLPINRHGYLEEVYWTCSYSPIWDQGVVGGVLVICTETTERVVGERRGRTLQDLTAKTAAAKTVESAYRLAGEIIAQNEADIPFALLYRLVDNQAHLAATAGIEPGTIASPEQVDLSRVELQTDIWSLAQVRQTGLAAKIDLTTAINTLPDWSKLLPTETPTTAIALPIAESGQQHPAGLLVVGISPKQAFNDEYREFVQAIANQIANAIAHAHVHEADYQQAAAALRESEERFRQMAETIESVFWLLDLKAQQHLYVSPAYKQIWGRSCESSIDFSSWLETIHPEDRESIRTALAKCLAQGTHEEEYRVVRPNGSIRWVRDRGFVVRDAQGKAYRLVGVAEDITERKQVEVRLRESEEQFRNMADNAPVMVWVTDPRGYCTYLSQSWYEFTGQTEETGLGFGWMNAVHPEDMEYAKKTFLAANENHEAFRLNYRLRRKNGKYCFCIDAASPWFGVDGQFKGFIGSVIDITDRKQIEEALRLSESRYRTLFESIDEGFCIIEMLFDEQDKPIDYRFLEINPVFEQQTGLRQAIGKTARQLIPNIESHWINIYGNVALTGESVRFENGSEAMNRWFDVYACPIDEPEAGKVAIVFKDITERKLIEQEREQLLEQEQLARAEAEQANRIKDEFLAVLSHELRTPLNPILGWSKLLQSRQLNESQTALGLATIERNAKLQTQLIDDLLDMARILRGKLSLNLTTLDLSSIVKAAVETVRAAATAKYITLHTVLPNIGQVSGDATRLQQIVWNLLSNAIKFTPSGGRVHIRLQQVDDWAEITVRDTGKGISPDFLVHIFDSFRQEDNSITRNYGGLGLGLAIVRQLVEAHGGTIRADSPGIGRGAIFTVRLPLHDVEPEINPKDELPHQKLNLAGIRVLAVDDEPDARQLLEILLGQYGAEVLTVSSAAEALIALQSFQPNVLVSDIGMPVVDGFTLLEQIRTLPPERGGGIPAIALTAYAREEDRQRALASDYQRHIAKPFELKQLVEAVAALTQI